MVELIGGANAEACPVITTIRDASDVSPSIFSIVNMITCEGGAPDHAICVSVDIN
jgi:hypothetical protein